MREEDAVQLAQEELRSGNPFALIPLHKGADPGAILDRGLGILELRW